MRSNWIQMVLLAMAHGILGCFAGLVLGHMYSQAGAPDLAKYIRFMALGIMILVLFWAERNLAKSLKGGVWIISSCLLGFLIGMALGIYQVEQYDEIATAMLPLITLPLLGFTVLRYRQDLRQRGTRPNGARNLDC